MYHLTHEAMGEIDLFLVPIEKKESAFRYEAVFNYYKSESESEPPAVAGGPNGFSRGCPRRGPVAAAPGSDTNAILCAPAVVKNLSG